MLLDLSQSRDPLIAAIYADAQTRLREQNPDLISGENSAEALLERIKAEREKAKPVKSVREKRVAS